MVLSDAASASADAESRCLHALRVSATSASARSAWRLPALSMALDRNALTLRRAAGQPWKLC